MIIELAFGEKRRQLSLSFVQESNELVPEILKLRELGHHFANAGVLGGTRNGENVVAESHDLIEIGLSTVQSIA